MPRIRLTEKMANSRSITARLDQIASEIENSYPKLALTIDQISDTLERNAAQLSGAKSGKSQWTGMDLKNDTEEDLIKLFEKTAARILYYMKNLVSNPGGSLAQIKKDINDITGILNRFLEIRQAPQKAPPAGQVAPAKPPQQAQPTRPAAPASPAPR